MITVNNETGKRQYFDKFGVEITAGCTVKFPSGETFEVYETTEGELGTDSTNPAWIKSGRAVPCEFGIFPLNLSDTQVCAVVRK